MMGPLPTQSVLGHNAWRQCMAWAALCALFDTAWADEQDCATHCLCDSQRMLLQAPLGPGGAVTFFLRLLVLSSRPKP